MVNDSFLTMPHPQQFTFISDATDEFPNNKNNSFKVRLPTQLQLSGENWYASLWSISVPDDEFLSPTLMFGNVPNVLHAVFSLYRLYNYIPSNGKYSAITTFRRTTTVTMPSVLSKSNPVRTGVDFWTNAFSQMANGIQSKLNAEKRVYTSGSVIGIPNQWKPTIVWQGDDFILPSVDEASVLNSSNEAISAFGIELEVARKFGFVNDTKNKLGPNVMAAYPEQKEEGTFIESSITNAHSLLGTNQVARFTQDIDTSDPKVDYFRMLNGYVFFSRALQWTFYRVNTSFQALLNTKETVMVYSDLVQSSVVGSGRFPLLREVTLERTGKGRVTIEPRHREWIPIRSKTIDMVEIELATASGPLTHLTEGKTIVTVGLQHEV